MNNNHSQTIEFITFLRALAAIIVMLSHLLCMYWVGGVGSIWPFLDNVQSAYGLKSINPATYLSSIYLNAGSIGVAFFFLITGYLLPQSIHKYKKPGKFLIVKLIRICPVYLIGFSITFFNIWLYTHFNEIEFPYSFADWLSQVSLLRVFFWLPSIDGISWTLVADVQLYLIMALMIAIRKTSTKHFTIAGIMIAMLSAFCSINMPSLLEAGEYPLYHICSHITLASFCLTFMLLGVVIAEYDTGKIDRSQLVSSVFVLFLCFISSCASYSLETVTQNLCSYALSLLVFIVCRTLSMHGHCGKMFKNRFMEDVSRISYSLFILHGLNGYILETVLFKAKINNYLNFIITVFAMFLLATAFYFCCERPISKIQKRIAKNLIANDNCKVDFK